MPTSHENIPGDVSSIIEDLQRRVEALEKKVAELTGETLDDEDTMSGADSEDETIDLEIDESPSDGILSEPEPEESNPDEESVPEPESEESASETASGATSQETKSDEGIHENEAHQEQHISTLFGEIVQEQPQKKRGRKKAATSINEANEGGGKAVMDVMAEKNAWLSDLPGPEVKSLRSAIGLGDQILFINRLFRSDAALYQSTIEKLNGMKTLKEAVTYISETFPEWDVESEDVYRFMMAVRRKIRR